MVSLPRSRSQASASSSVNGRNGVILLVSMSAIACILSAGGGQAGHGAINTVAGR